MLDWIYKNKLKSLFGVCLFIFLCGIFSDLHLGDEVLHFRLAETIFQTNVWPIYDSMNQSYANQKLYYIDPMLWHTLLSWIWKVTGINKAVAQLYQTCYFFILITGFFIWVKQLYTEKIAFFSALILSSIPIFPALTVILQTDIASVALIIWCLVFLFKEKFLYAGLTGGAAFLIKRTTYLFIPAILIFLLFSLKGSFKKRAASCLSFFAVILPLAYIGWEHHRLMISLVNTLPPGKSLLFKHNQIIKYVLKDIFDIKQNLVLMPFYIGFGFIFSFLLYFLKPRFRKQELAIWLSVACFFILYLCAFIRDVSVRYILVIIPMFAIISGIALERVKSKLIKDLIIVLCLAQLISATLYTAVDRRIPQDVKDVYKYIKLNTPEKAVIMCSRPDPQYYALRETMWNNYLAIKEITQLFWISEDKEILQILKKYNINYLLIEKDRIYDDRIVKHQLGWPSSFVEKIKKYHFLQEEIDNKYITLWKVVE